MCFTSFYKTLISNLYSLTGVQCDLIDSEMLRKGKAPSKAPYFWTQKEHFTLEQLQKRLFEPNQLHPLDAEEKLSLGMVILTEAFLFTPGSLEKIPLSRLVHASEFAIYTSQPWGKHAYRVLATSIQRINENTWARGTYEVKGFAMAILLWAFSAVPSLGSAFATECVTSRSEYPLCLKWETTQTPRFSHVVDVVKKMNSVSVESPLLIALVLRLIFNIYHIFTRVFKGFTSSFLLPGQG